MSLKINKEEEKKEDIEKIEEKNKWLTQAPFIKLLSKDAKIPTRGSKYAAGYDIYTPYEFKLIAGGKRECIKVNFSITPPSGYFFKIECRSGLAAKGINIHGGIIDEDYTGDIGVIISLSASTDKDAILEMSFKKHDRIAQLILYAHGSYPDIDFIQVDELPKTDRGAGGFGSTDNVNISRFHVYNTEKK